METKNCHGCKHLDRYKVNGRGYCCMVVRIASQSEQCRLPHMERCELYAKGKFADRLKRGGPALMGDQSCRISKL